MKDKLKSYDFWASVLSAVLVVLQTLSMKFDIPRIAEVATAFLGALSVAGILKKNKVKSEAVAETADGGEVGAALPSESVCEKEREDDDRSDSEEINKPN